MKNKNTNTPLNQNSVSDVLYIALAGVYIISRPLLESPTFIDIAVGASLIMIAVKQYIISKRNK